MTDDFTAQDAPLAGTAAHEDPDRSTRDAATPTRTLGEDGTTLTGESADSGDASRRPLVEPAPGHERRTPGGGDTA